GALVIAVVSGIGSRNGVGSDVRDGALGDHVGRVVLGITFGVQHGGVEGLAVVGEGNGSGWWVVDRASCRGPIEETGQTTFFRAQLRVGCNQCAELKLSAVGDGSGNGLVKLAAGREYVEVNAARLGRDGDLCFLGGAAGVSRVSTVLTPDVVGSARERVDVGYVEGTVGQREDALASIEHLGDSL